MYRKIYPRLVAVCLAIPLSITQVSAGNNVVENALL
jgi:hypothetical protein